MEQGSKRLLRKIKREYKRYLKSIRYPRATVDDFKKIGMVRAELKDLEEEDKRIKDKYNLKDAIRYE